MRRGEERWEGKREGKRGEEKKEEVEKRGKKKMKESVKYKDSSFTIFIVFCHLILGTVETNFDIISQRFLLVSFEGLIHFITFELSS